MSDERDALRELCRAARTAEAPDEVARHTLGRRLVSKGLLPASAAGLLLLRAGAAGARTTVGSGAVANAAGVKTSFVAMALYVASGASAGVLLGVGMTGALEPSPSTPAVASVSMPSVAASRGEQHATPPSVVSVPAPRVVAPTRVPSPVASPASSPARTHVARSRGASAAGNLAKETRGLLEAQRALRDSSPTQALEVLVREERDYRGGMLRAERQVARILALCAAGRLADAAAEREDFLKTHRNSPLSGRVRQGCDAR